MNQQATDQQEQHILVQRSALLKIQGLLEILWQELPDEHRPHGGSSMYSTHDTISEILDDIIDAPAQPRAYTLEEWKRLHEIHAQQTVKAAIVTIVYEWFFHWLRSQEQAGNIDQLLKSKKEE